MIISPSGPLITLGRATDCTVPIRDRYLSRRHAEIVFDVNAWLVRDLGASVIGRLEPRVQQRFNEPMATVPVGQQGCGGVEIAGIERPDGQRRRTTVWSGWRHGGEC
jgi:hypothetical protein